PGLQVQPDAGVSGQRVEHVAEEAVEDVDPPLAALQAQLQADVRLAGGALDAAGAPRRLSSLFSRRTGGRLGEEGRGDEGAPESITLPPPASYAPSAFAIVSPIAAGDSTT
ncbi:MAG TPA: hypothetical protein VGQ28_13080, partial [Thermoanaerobaculia bacterium]|nr:hypothetical protein [Thermoanaerobaculia bacterium]